MIDKIKNDLIRDEGLKLYPYKCTAGKLTIGVGRNIEDNGITKDEAMYLLGNDIARCQAELSKAISFYDRLDDSKKSILINMCFNMGISRLIGFKRMLAAMAIGDWATAAHEMANSTWAFQVGDRAKRLMEQMRG